MYPIVFELCATENKEEEEEERKKVNKTEIFMFNFLNFEKH